MILYIYSVLLLCFVNGSLSSKHLPSYIKKCTRDQRTISECVGRSIEALRPRLAEGLRELDVPGIDPFYIPEIVIISGSQIPLNAVGRDVKVTGAGNFTLKSFTVDLDTLTIRARLRIPKLYMEGQYSVNVQVLVVPLKGKGTMKFVAVKCDAEIVMKGQLEKKNGVEYMSFKSMDTDISVKDYRIQLEGLFNGDKVLGDATNEAINQNKGEFLREVKPFIESTVSKLFLDIANKVITDIPFDEMLPKP